jgi:hypothetical protein
MMRTASACLVRHVVLAAAIGALVSCGGGGGSPGVTGGGIGIGVTGGSSGNSSVAGTTAFGFSLTGAQEIPANTSVATGAGTMNIDLVTGNFTASVTTAGIAATSANIQAAPAGSTGPVVFPMVQTTPGGNTWITSGRLTSAQVANLNAGGYYVNVASLAFPNGEIRAQIVPPQAIVLQPATTGGSGVGVGIGLGF